MDRLTDQSLDQPSISDQAKSTPRSDDQPNNEQNVSSTELIDSSANKQLSQDSLANKQLSQPLTKLTIDPVNNKTQLGQSVAKPSISLASYYRTWNYLDDEIMPTLHPSEQLVLRRLYRLAYGFNRQTTDNVSLTKLAEKCNLGVATVKLAIRSLQDKGLIKIESDLSRNPGGGNKYHVLTKLPDSLTIIELGQSVAKLSISHIKDHDDDPLKGQDHHQGTVPNINDHQKQVMMIYQEITGNLWSKADHSNYEKIKHIPIDKIEVALRLAYDRATNRPNSFAFFIKEIIASVNPKTQSRTTRKKAMQKVVERVRNASVGSNISPSEFVYKVKEACLREDVNFDNDLLDEILSKT